MTDERRIFLVCASGHKARRNATTAFDTPCMCGLPMELTKQGKNLRARDEEGVAPERTYVRCCNPACDWSGMRRDCNRLPCPKCKGRDIQPSPLRRVAAHESARTLVELPKGEAFGVRSNVARVFAATVVAAVVLPNGLRARVLAPPSLASELDEEGDVYTKPTDAGDPARTMWEERTGAHRT